MHIAIDKETGKKRGFCQVEFEKHEEAQKAVAELTNTELDNREVRIEMSNKKMPEPDEGGYGGQSDSSVIFCGNISYRASEQKIKDFFSQAGEVKEVVIAID